MADQSQSRNLTIDALRALGIVLIVVIHTQVLFLANPISAIIWNLSQFSVPLLVFCSGYVYKDGPILKRLRRLLVPYWIFLVFLIALLFIFHDPILNVNFVVQSILLTGGADMNWLVLLFIQLLILQKAYDLVKTKSVWVGRAIMIFLHIFCLVTFFYYGYFHNHYRLWMPFGWVIIVIYSYWVKANSTNTKALLQQAGKYILIFIPFLAYLLYTHSSTRFFDHKYPIDIYYLAYGIATVTATFFICSRIPFDRLPRVLGLSIDFLSRNSYQIFFIHYLLIYATVHIIRVSTLGPWIFLTWIMISTIVVTYGVSLMSRKYQSLRGTK